MRNRLFTRFTGNARRHGLLAALLLVAACAANSADYITYYLNKGFKDHPVNDFFYNYGYPTAEFDQAGGNKVYEWTSARPPVKVSDGNSHTRDFSDGSYYHMTDDYQGSPQRQYCELRIYTDREDNITGFAVAVDSIGKWSSSRCSEIFDKVYP